MRPHHLLLALTPLAPQGADVQSAADAFTLATYAQERGDPARARELYERALLLAPARPLVLLRCAECSAAQGDESAAASYLLASASLGLRNADELEANPSFASLRTRPLWGALVARVAASAAEYERSIRLPELRSELLVRMKRDQDSRERISDLPFQENCAGEGTDAELELVTVAADDVAPECVLSGLEEVDRGNTAWMREVVARHGWPTRSLVGDDGATAAWLLVQHADLDPTFQRRCLELMRAAPAGEIPPDHLAYLTDRVAMNAGEPQTYGTQFRAEGGTMVPFPMLDPGAVDERRRAMGLCSLAIYREHMQGDHAPDPGR